VVVRREKRQQIDAYLEDFLIFLEGLNGGAVGIHTRWPSLLRQMNAAVERTSMVVQKDAQGSWPKLWEWSEVCGSVPHVVGHEEALLWHKKLLDATQGCRTYGL
jgi:hypothetical protein